MYDDFLVFIKSCRKNARLTLEQAAYQLNVSPRQVSNYESGYHRVSDDIAVSMARAYKNPLIIYKWLRCNKCGQMILPDLGNQALAENILDVLMHVEQIQKRTSELINIGRDGKVDKREQTSFDKINDDYCIPLAKSLIRLALCNKKTEPSRRQLS